MLRVVTSRYFQANCEKNDRHGKRFAAKLPHFNMTTVEIGSTRDIQILVIESTY
jgi:hypothetical protein